MKGLITDFWHFRGGLKRLIVGARRTGYIYLRPICECHTAATVGMTPIIEVLLLSLMDLNLHQVF